MIDDMVGMIVDKLKVLISNRQKEVKIPSGIRLLIRRCCHAVLAFENFQGSAEVSVSFISNDEIRALNQQYREKDAPTDVLSFPLGENGSWDKNEAGGLPARQMREKEEAVLQELGLSRNGSYVV